MAEVTLPNTLTDGADAYGSEVMANLNAIVSQVNGGLDATNLEDAAVTADKIAEAVAVLLGVSTAAGGVRRGKSIVATEETRTGTGYGLMTTPDRVSSLVLPSDGLICIAYQAMWKESVNAAARAAVFIGGIQLNFAPTDGNPTGQECDLAVGAADVYKPLHSYHGGLKSGGSAGAYTGDLTTGQIVGGGAAIAAPEDAVGGLVLAFAAAGTYDVSVLFRASSGSVTAKNRKLWAWTLGF